MPVTGRITSMEPHGNDVGAPKDVTFVVKAGFSPDDLESYDVTLKFIILNETLSESPGSAGNTWRVKTGEQGEIDVPVSYTIQSLHEGNFIVVASLVSFQLPNGPTITIDSKSSIYILTK